MAGSNQAANLGGMLSQIGGSLSKAPDISGLVRNVENMGRPEVDPNSPASLEALAQWQQKMGRTDEARLTQIQLNAVEARRKEEEAKAAAQKKAGALASYQQVVNDPNATPEAIREARNKAMAVGQALGVDMVGPLNGIDANNRSAIQMQWAADDKAKQDADTNASNMIAGKLAGVKSIDEIDQVIKDTPEEFKALAVKMGAAQTAHMNQMAAVRAREAENVGTVDTERDYSSLPPDLRKQFERDQEQINKDKAKSFVNGTWVQGSKSEIMRRQNELDRNMRSTIINLASSEVIGERQLEREYRTAMNKAIRPTKVQIEAAKAELTREAKEADTLFTWEHTPTEEEILQRAIENNKREVNFAFGRDETGNTPEGEKPKDTGKQGSSVNNPVSVDSEEAYNSLPSGTYYIKAGETKPRLKK